MRPDVIVLGAGSAGAAAAWQLARRGLSVVVLERSPLERAGARWHNGVVGWGFDESGLARPTPPEGRPSPGVRIVAGHGPVGIDLPAVDVLEVDMTLLVARLQGLAADAGADLRPGVTVEAVHGATVHTSQGPLEASFVVDATGVAGVTRPRVPREDLCTAAQEMRELAHPAAAEAWFRAQGAAPDVIVNLTGVAGGYSVLQVRLHEGQVGLLAGTMPRRGVPAGRVLLDRFVASQSWIGARISGGARAIPVGAPRVPLAVGPLARLGDAADQVYAGHGSGVAVHLVAARLLADALAAGGTPHDYARAWNHRFGRDLRASARFQRVARTLDPEVLARWMRSGLMHPAFVRATQVQGRPTITPRVVAELVAAGLRDPGAALRILPVVAGMVGG